MMTQFMNKILVFQTRGIGDMIMATTYVECVYRGLI